MIEWVKSVLTPRDQQMDDVLHQRRLDSLLFGAEQARKRALAELARTERLARRRP